MTLVAHFDLKLHQMNVKIVFLNSDIEETIYMAQPENFVSGDSKNMVCKLKKKIYLWTQASFPSMILQVSSSNCLIWF